MKREEIVRKCLERGLLVSSEELSRLESGMSIDELERLRPSAQDARGEIKLRMQKAGPVGTVTPDDVIRQRASAYESLRKMLLTKAKAISISNVRDSSAPVSVIGMVRQAGQHGFTLEDTTGDLEVLSDDTAPTQGDVICACGPVRAGKMSCRETVFPDVPLLRGIGRMEAKALFSGERQEADVVFLPAEVIVEGKTHALESNPAQLSLHRQGGRIRVLVFRSAQTLEPHDAIGMLKRRIIRPGGVAPFVIDVVPDIFWIAGTGREWTETYKGVSILHTSGRGFFVDLNTREILGGPTKK